MAEMFEADVTDYSFFPAGEDLSTKQWHIVKFDTSTGTIKLCDDSSEPYGILQNKPKAGRPAKVRIKGMSRVYVTSAGLAAGVQYTSDDYGKAVAAGATDGSMFLGDCFVAATAGTDNLATVSVDGGILHTRAVL